MMNNNQNGKIMNNIEDSNNEKNNEKLDEQKINLKNQFKMKIQKSKF